MNGIKVEPGMLDGTAEALAQLQAGTPKKRPSATSRSPRSASTSSQTSQTRGHSGSHSGRRLDVKVFNASSSRIGVRSYHNADFVRLMPRCTRHLEPGETAVVDVVRQGVTALKLRINELSCESVTPGCLYSFNGEQLLLEPTLDMPPSGTEDWARSRNSSITRSTTTTHRDSVDGMMSATATNPMQCSILDFEYVASQLEIMDKEATARLQGIQPTFLMSDEYEVLLEKKARYSGAWVTPDTHDASEVMHQGWLVKQGEGMMAFMRWRQRWFVLTHSGCFSYYRTEEDYARGEPPVGCLLCKDVTNLVCKMGGLDFDVVTANRIYHLKTQAGADRNEWVKALQSCGVSREVCVDDMELLRIIGQGAQASVAEVIDVGTGRPLAMKVYDLRKILRSDQRLERERVARERMLLAELRHPYIVGGQAAFRKDDRLYICMDFAQGGELWYHIHKNKDCPLYYKGTPQRAILAAFYTAEVVCALGYLHSKDILYADLKPENIAISREGHVKLIDFGLCQQEISSMTGQDGVPYKSEVAGDHIGGTHEYYAPELILTQQKGPLGKALDWWTVGVLFFELMMKVTPFRDKTCNHRVNMDKIKRGEWHQEWIDFPGIPFHAQNFAAQLLVPDPARRLGSQGTEEIMQHLFFAEMNLANWAKLQLVEVEPPWKPHADGIHFDAGQVKDAQSLKPQEQRIVSPQPLMTANGTVDLRRLTDIDPVLQGWDWSRVGKENEEDVERRVSVMPSEASPEWEVLSILN